MHNVQNNVNITSKKNYSHLAPDAFVMERTELYENYIKFTLGIL